MLADRTSRLANRLQLLAGRHPRAAPVWSAAWRSAIKPVGEGVSDLRIHHGPGYRVYGVRRGNLLIGLLRGGEKASRVNDVALALTLAKEV